MTAFLDTNILIYSVSSGVSESEKRSVAVSLLDQDDCALSVQVLNEFVWQSTRPQKGPGLTFETAFGYVAAWQRFPIQSLNLDIHQQATTLLRQQKFSWWDCLIVAAAQAQGCEILYSEDMQHGRIIDQLRIVDPFR